MAHILAFIGFAAALFFGFALIIGKGAFPPGLLGAAAFNLLYVGPFVFLATLIYFVLFRARAFAILLLLVVAAAILVANHFGHIQDAHRLWAQIASAGCIAAAVHHILLLMFRPATI